MMAPVWDAMAVVGHVARSHGNQGQMIVNPETDFPKERFRPGAVLYVRRGDRVRALRLGAVRFQRGRPIIQIEGISTIDEAKTLVSAELRIPAEALHALPEGFFYRHDLIGCRVWTTGGADIGVVKAVEGSTDNARLVVGSRRGDILIPMASDICVGVDVAGRTITVKPPRGLLELNDTRGTSI